MIVSLFCSTFASPFRRSHFLTAMEGVVILFYAITDFLLILKIITTYVSYFHYSTAKP